MKAPAANGPKTVRVFKNQPRTLDFSQAESMESIQVSKADTALSYVDGRYSLKKSLTFPNNTTLSIKKYRKNPCNRNFSPLKEIRMIIHILIAKEGCLV